MFFYFETFSVNPEIFLYNHGDQRFSLILNHHKCISASFDYMYLCYGSTAIIILFFFQCDPQL